MSALTGKLNGSWNILKKQELWETALEYTPKTSFPRSCTFEDIPRSLRRVWLLRVTQMQKTMRLLWFNLVTDFDDPVLGFTTSWIRDIAKLVESIQVITMRKGRMNLPKNVRITSVGKERGFTEPRRAFEFLSSPAPHPPSGTHRCLLFPYDPYFLRTCCTHSKNTRDSYRYLVCAPPKELCSEPGSQPFRSDGFHQCDLLPLSRKEADHLGTRY